jgi:hypothetical protein
MLARTRNCKCMKAYPDDPGNYEKSRRTTRRKLEEDGFLDKVDTQSTYVIAI